MPNQRELRDQAARNAIVEQLGVNMLVEAGAGAGKTDSTARRIAAMVASGSCLIEQVAAVTFTRKAAAELVGRCRLELEHSLALTSGQRAQRLRQALADSERMFAGTIHSFCAQLLRERPVESGIAPAFTELDEPTDDSLRERAWRDFVERSKAANSSFLAELEAAQVRPKDLDEAFSTLCLYPDVDFPAGNAAAPEPEPAWKAIQVFSADLTALLPASIDPETTCPIQKQLREFLPRMRWADHSSTAFLSHLLAPWERNYKPTQKWWNSKTDALHASELIQHFQASTVTPFLSQWRRYLYRLIVSLGVEARNFTDECRRRAAELNYEDLLQRTAAVLRSNDEVLAALQRKYRHLFVDEFQDSDPVQTEIVFLLAAQPGNECDWRKAPLRPGALFLVGDAKQSIYRFRRADIDIYHQAKRRIQETGGKVLELTTCFRATPAVSDWVNTAFSALFPLQATPQQPAYRKLDGVNNPGGAPCGVFQLRLSAALERKEVPASDAQSIGAYIASEVSSGRRRWRDFLILTRKKSHLALYAAEMDRAGVRYEVSGSEAFQDSTSVEALASLLYSLANPDDAPALVGVLRGRLFGFSDEELFAYHRGGGRLLLNVAANTGCGVGQALSSIQEMYRWARTLPVAAAVERILDKTGLLARAYAESVGGAEAGKLLFAVDCLRSSAELGRSFAAAVRDLEDRLGAGEADAPALEPGREDVVRLMNLHKAKGLEAKVVFLADPLAGVKPKADVHIVREGNRAIGYFQVTRQLNDFVREVIAEPETWAVAEATELAYVAAEELRLLYVACTRAMQMLVVSIWDKADNYGVRPWANLAPFLGSAPQIEASGLAIEPPPDVPIITTTDRVTATIAREAVLAAVRAPTYVTEGVTAASVHRASTRLLSAPPDEPHGAAWGRLVHALLERAASSPVCSRQDLERYARFYVGTDAAAAPFRAESVHAVLQVVLSPFWAHVCEANLRLAEVPIMVVVPGSTPPLTQGGVIDLALKFDAGWEIIDYKTAVGDTVDIGMRFAGQVGTYAEHWERITGERVTFAGVYSIRENALTGNLRK